MRFLSVLCVVFLRGGGPVEPRINIPRNFSSRKARGVAINFVHFWIVGAHSYKNLALMMMAMHMVENGNINTIVEQRSLGSIG